MTALGRSVAPSIAPGEPLVPGYEAIAHLRRGNDLDVYDAWSHERGTRCVVKALRPDRIGDERLTRALLAEGELLTGLSHPHIVRGYETVAEPLPAIVLETLAGQTLAHLIETEGPADAVSAAHLGLHLGSAVRYLHRHGVLHLDLKPSNVIAEAGRARLIDLSLARPPGILHAGIGTWHYLSPEQARGGWVDAAADVWGLGAVLFQAATGETPFGDDPDAWEAASESGASSATGGEPERYPQLERVARPAELVRPIAFELASLIAACLEPDPARRPQLEHLLGSLERLAELPAGERRWATAPLRALSSPPNCRLRVRP